MSGQPCHACGATMTPGVRYEAERTVDVWLCLDCGAETPPLYRRSRTVRNGLPFAATSTCRGCGRQFGDDAYRRHTYCSPVCQPRPIAFGIGYLAKRRSA